MSVKVMGLVWDHYPAGGGELLAALALADQADHEGGSVRPGVALLVRKTRQSERAIRGYLHGMRRATWLLVERYSRGGHGRATEYRINPAWISNPAEFAPFSQIHKGCSSQHKRVQNGSRNPADSAPQLQRTVIEPTTTTQPTMRAVVVAVDFNNQKIELPGVLSGSRAPSAIALLKRCPLEFRQLVVNEVAGVAARGRLHSTPIALLRTLVQCARDGTFVANHAIEFDDKRRQAIEASQRAIATEQPSTRADLVSTRESAVKGLKALREILAGDSNTGATKSKQAGGQ